MRTEALNCDVVAFDGTFYEVHGARYLWDVAIQICKWLWKWPNFPLNRPGAEGKCGSSGVSFNLEEERINPSLEGINSFERGRCLRHIYWPRLQNTPSELQGFKSIIVPHLPELIHPTPPLRVNLIKLDSSGLTPKNGFQCPSANFIHKKVVWKNVHRSKLEPLEKVIIYFIAPEQLVSQPGCLCQFMNFLIGSIFFWILIVFIQIWSNIFDLIVRLSWKSWIHTL